MSSQNREDPFEIHPESGLGGRWPIRWRPGTSVQGDTRFWPSCFRVYPISAIALSLYIDARQIDNKILTDPISTPSGETINKHDTGNYGVPDRQQCDRHTPSCLALIQLLYSKYNCCMESYTPPANLALIHHLSLCVNFHSFARFEQHVIRIIEVDTT